jgi:ABC-type amino acid transport substrate-binding protein
MRVLTGWLPHLGLLAMLLAACARPSSQTQPPVSRLEQITRTGVMRVGVAVDIPPFAYLDRQGERQGFDIELMGEIANRMGVEVTWVDAAYEPLRDAVRDGKLDVAIGAIPYSEEWDLQVDFSQPYYDLGEPGPADPGLLFIILPQGEQALAERLDQIIAKLESEGFIEQLAQKYLAPR